VNLLALETSTEWCSVALLAGGATTARGEFAPRRHAELLLPMCEAVLAEAGLARSRLDAIAVGRGPGAFTGVRLAVAAAQGIALGLGVPVVPVSTLAALALDAPVDRDVLAVIDARMGEIYAGAFRHRDGLVEAIGAESVGRADVLVAPESAAGWHVIGSGWTSYADAITARIGGAPAWADGERFPQAAAVARLAAPLARAGHGVATESALPVYLRDRVALTSAERAAGQSL
jgi:tRNA threonylcarbamoyladenosine biosynthesis protein TsaB